MYTRCSTIVKGIPKCDTGRVIVGLRSNWFSGVVEKQRTIRGNVKKRSLVWPSLVNITQKSLDIAIIKSIHEGGFDKYILFSLKARVEFNG